MSAPVQIEWSHDSGLNCRMEVAAFAANWFNTLYQWPRGTREMEESKLLLGLRRQLVPDRVARIYGVDPGFNGIAYTGDAVDERGVRVSAGPGAVLRLLDEELQTILERPVPADGVFFRPGQPLPSGQGGHYEQLVCHADGEVFARCFENGWHGADYEWFSGRRGFLLYVAPKSWLDLQNGQYHVEAQHRSRLSPLAARQAA